MVTEPEPLLKLIKFKIPSKVEMPSQKGNNTSRQVYSSLQVSKYLSSCLIPVWQRGRLTIVVRHLSIVNQIWCKWREPCLRVCNRRYSLVLIRQFPGNDSLFVKPANFVKSGVCTMYKNQNYKNVTDERIMFSKASLVSILKVYA